MEFPHITKIPGNNYPPHQAMLLRYVVLRYLNIGLLIVEVEYYCTSSLFINYKTC